MKLAAVLIALSLSGCAQFLKVQDKSAEQIAKAIHEYCLYTDESLRLQFRAAVNEKAAPNSIAVTCQ